MCWWTLKHIYPIKRIANRVPKPQQRYVEMHPARRGGTRGKIWAYNGCTIHNRLSIQRGLEVRDKSWEDFHFPGKSDAHSEPCPITPMFALRGDREMARSARKSGKHCYCCARRCKSRARHLAPRLVVEQVIPQLTIPVSRSNLTHCR